MNIHFRNLFRFLFLIFTQDPYLYASTSIVISTSKVPLSSWSSSPSSSHTSGPYVCCISLTPSRLPPLRRLRWTDVRLPVLMRAPPTTTTTPPRVTFTFWRLVTPCVTPVNLSSPLDNQTRTTTNTKIGLPVPWRYGGRPQNGAFRLQTLPERGRVPRRRPWCS